MRYSFLHFSFCLCAYSLYMYMYMYMSAFLNRCLYVFFLLSLSLSLSLADRLIRGYILRATREFSRCFNSCPFLFTAFGVLLSSFFINHRIHFRILAFSIFFPSFSSLHPQSSYFLVYCHRHRREKTADVFIGIDETNTTK